MQGVTPRTFVTVSEKLSMITIYTSGLLTPCRSNGVTLSCEALWYILR